MGKGIVGPKGGYLKYCVICNDTQEFLPNPKTFELTCTGCGAKHLSQEDLKKDRTVKMYCPVCKATSQFCLSPYAADECVCIRCGVVFVMDILKVANRGRS